jgi:UDP-N-acetylglucosamine--N-acetylmuramyl-(pentapeptide) pyrophosphoryl-undecaprenol N-acetylglucosamine transferase
MPRQSKKMVVLTGGHAATTAMATIEEIIRREKDNWDLYWIGAKYAVEGKKVPTLESSFIPKKGVSFYPIVTGRLQRKFTFWTIPSLLKIPFGFFHAFIILLKIKPDIVLSFGGYAAFPVVVSAWLLRIPVVIHEQTMGAGRANISSSFFAKKIAISRKESAKYFKKGKTVVTGNPVMTQITEISPREKLNEPPTLLVSGGSRGSMFINNLIAEILPDLLKKYYVIHITGEIGHSEMSKLKETLPKKLSENYEIYDLIDPMQIDGVYKRADVMVSRAGANTVSEIIMAKIPSILVPLPISYQDEQTLNAKYAEKFGIATVLPQKSLNFKKLFKEIEKTFKEREKIIKRVKTKKSPDLNASEKLVDILEAMVK